MHHNCGFFLEQLDESLHQQGIISPSKCIILYFETVGAVSAVSDIFKDKMETVLFLLPQRFH